MIFIINEWYGRFGNNFISIVNAIMSAKNHKAKLIIPKHPVFNTYNIDFSNGNTDTILFENNFYYNNKYSVKISKKELIECVNEYVIKMIPQNMLNNDFPDDVLVLHIRSGDIFLGNYFQLAYIQPPFSYYDKIIRETHYKKYLIVSESYHNPVIKMLKDKYEDKIIINKIENTIYNMNNSFILDLSIMLNAKNIVLSTSSLSFAIMCLSKKKNVYLFNTIYKFTDSDNNFNQLEKILWYSDNVSIHYYIDTSYFDGIKNADDMIEKIKNYKINI
jgi:hypothetical protein